MTDPTPSEQKAASTSLGDLIGEVTKDLSTLMRQELELAKAELKRSASRAGKGAGMLGGAGYAASMVLLKSSAPAASSVVTSTPWPTRSPRRRSCIARPTR